MPGDGVREKLKLDPAPTPGEVSSVAESIDDYTAPTAHGRTLYINIGFLKFGIDDKALALAMVLTFLLLIFILVFGVISIWNHESPIASIVDALLKALFMAIGVIVGRKVGGKG